MSRLPIRVAAVCLAVLFSPLSLLAGEETAVLIRGGSFVDALQAVESVLGPALETQKHPSKQAHVTIHRFRFSEEEDLLLYQSGEALIQVVKVPLDGTDFPKVLQDRNYSRSPRSYVLSRKGKRVSLVIAYVSKDLWKREWVCAWQPPKPPKSAKGE